MKKKIAAVVLAACLTAGAFVLLVGAVRGESSDDAKADFCDSVSELEATIASYQGLNPATASIGELDAAEDEIYGAWEEVVADAEDWANAYDNPLDDAYDDLYWEIQFLPEDYTVAESLDAVSDELAEFPEAFDEAFDGSGCTSS